MKRLINTLNTSVLLLLASISLASCSVEGFKQSVHDTADNVNDAADNIGAMAENMSKAYKQFMDQLNRPNEKLNTGVSYWLELQRSGEKSRVTSKTLFRNGDKIRFHIKPNIDAYAYIVMLEGSNGESSVLFPVKHQAQEKLQAGKEVILPRADGENAWLKFDNNPGTEVLRIIVSRNKIKPGQSADDGTRGTVTIGSGERTDDIPDESAVDMVMDEDSEGKPAATRNLTVVTTKKHSERHGETTVINGDPKKALVVDIALRHGT